MLGAIPLLIHRLVERALDRTTQRAEYLADERAARVGGTMAGAGMMELLLLEASIRLALQRAANERVADPVGYRAITSHIYPRPSWSDCSVWRTSEDIASTRPIPLPTFAWPSCVPSNMSTHL